MSFFCSIYLGGGITGDKITGLDSNMLSITSSTEKQTYQQEIMSFTYDENGLPLSITFQGNTYWYVYNGHGDVVALTDKDGKVAARYEYNAWGLTTKMYNQSGDRVREGIGWIGDLGTGNGTPGSINGPTQDNTNYDLHPGNGNGQAKGWNKQTQGAVKIQSADSTVTSDTQAGTNTTSVETTSTTDTTTTDITTELVKQNPYRYAHYYWDRKTQYYYLHARYYDPRDGRFMSLDTIEGQVTNPLTLNRYLYTANNPVNYIDPTGHISFWANIQYVEGDLFGIVKELGKQSIDTFVGIGDLFKRETYKAIGRLIKAIKNGEITLEDLKYLVPDEVRYAIIYQLKHEEEMNTGDPSPEEAYQYGLQEGMVEGYVVSLVLVPGVLVKFVKTSSRIAKIMFAASKGKIKKAYDSAKTAAEGTSKVEAKIFNAGGDASLRATRRPIFDNWMKNGVEVNGQKFNMNQHAYNRLFKSGRKDIMPDDITTALSNKSTPGEPDSVVYTNPSTGTKVFVNPTTSEIVGVQPGTFK